MFKGKTYRIETERLVIRCYEPEQDAPLLLDAIHLSLPELLPWMPWAKNEPESLEAKVERLRSFKEDFISGKDFTFGIFPKSETALIGSTGLHTRRGETAREIGYWANTLFTRKGFMLENVSALIKVAFDIEGMHWIEIRCDSRNTISKKIPQRLQFKMSGTDPGTDAHGQARETEIWTLTKDAFEKSELKKMKLKAFDHVGKEILF